MLDRGGFGGRGAKRGGKFNNRGRGGGQSQFLGEPDKIIEVGTVSHACEDELVIKCTLTEQVPYFNARIFLSNKQEIGKIDEIFGPLDDYYCSVKLSEGVKAKSFEENSKLYLDPVQTLPMARFLPGAAKQGADKTAKKKIPVNKGKQFTKGVGRGGFRLNRGNSKAIRGTMMRGRGTSF
ncbi:small nuclear ribonucleoprotein gar1, putative [Theileria equi strain WA]|uniref:H/ACA ribonucleoprotein complex subunit n=1 Tax=Theileria equi strain WA TaxID=1537102 RepID=L0B1U0_THEEQ|nr:small nuclear ribonucleoprotein gar1, putative [Theileria equi strain WA]AFZ81216.1 small nuclear ribonucleoprotein gar1, putative [Theileria equi strain WA]|eukprot:XP_004830882.1 small nuclear ribonucleoprotein gar1, putative [Theileria equi strain WA]